MATTTCLFLLFFFALKSIMSQEVVRHPYSRLVPVGTDVYFSCKLRNAQYPYWMVNNIEVNTNLHRNHLSARGIYILDNEQSNGITTLTLQVNSSYSSTNNTQITCRTDGIMSRTAILLTINHSPLSQNPTLWQKNSTAILLQWSSPYLWPGCSIEMFNISIRNRDNNHVIYHQIHANFDDKIVDFMFIQEVQQDNCSEFTFGISAVSTDSQELPTVYITGGYASDLQPVNISAVALFRADGVPVLVQVKIELPQSICSFQELNYSIFIEDSDGNVQTQLGPRNHHGPGNLHQNIIYLLEKGKEYVAGIKAESILGNTTSRYPFSTKLEAASTMPTSIMVTNSGPTIVKDTHIYKIALGVCLFLLIVSITSIFMCICIYCIRRRQEKSSNRSVNRICNTLVPNPIYDGPVYESVLPNFEALIANSQQTDIEKSETELSDQTFSVPSTQDITQPNSARYVNHPIQLSHLSIEQNESESNDNSQLQVTRNEQITHFTSSVADNRRATILPNSETKATINSTEEAYTLMQSAGTFTF